MSDTQTNVRVVLGPVARQLIEGKGQNRQQALEDAIEALQEQAQGGETVVPSPALPAAALASLEAVVARNSEALTGLAAITAKELKLTRILIASLMTTKSEEQHQLIEMTEQVIQDLHRNGQLLGTSEMEKLEELDARQRELVSREVQRGAELEREVQEEELER